MKSGMSSYQTKDSMTQDISEPKDRAVIIPHHNDLTRLQRCLTALWPQMQPDVDAVVVDNGSDPAIASEVLALTRTFPGLRLEHETQKGAAHARNRGVAATTARYLLFLDCDCVPDADWLMRTRASCDMADLVGGRVRVFDETPPPRSGAEAFETVFAFDNRDYVQRKGFSVTANLVTRRDVFEAAGPFVNGLSEDVDWCRRATAAGFHLTYDDALGVSHPTRSDWSALVRKWRRMTDEGFRVRGRGPLVRLRWAVRALAMPASVIFHLLRVVLHPDLRDWTERARGAGTLARLRGLRMVWMLRQAILGR